ncbi:MAG: hypothetical protein NT175_09485 [Bacteroidetes bacterium]|nr:hypothetical protein [Bacteroidota bacterium]
MDFQELIITWYDQHKRDLPWRHTEDLHDYPVPRLIEMFLQDNKMSFQENENKK